MQNRSKLPDHLGWLLQKMAIFVIPILILQQAVQLHIAGEHTFAAENEFIPFFRAVGVIFIVTLVVGYFVGKGLEGRKEWARKVLVLGCWTFSGAVLLLGLYFTAYLTDGPILFSVGAGLTTAINVSIPGYIAFRFDKQDIQNQFKPAAQTTDRSISQVAPSAELDAREHFLRGNDFAKHKDYLQAIACFDKAISVSPTFAKAFRNRGIAHIRTGQRKEANEDFRSAYQLGLKSNLIQKLIDDTSDR